MMKNQICTILLLVSTLGLLTVVRAAEDSLDDHQQTRVLDSYVDPNCTQSECKDLNLVYVRSSRFKSDGTTKSGPDLHFVLSTVGGSPAFFVASTNNDSTTEINWDKLINNQPHSIQFLPPTVGAKPVFNNSIGLMISRVFFWLDNAKADAEFSPTNPNITELNLEGKWQNMTVISRTKDNVHVQYDLVDEENKGNISVKFMITSATQRYVDLPSLTITPKAVHTQLKINGFEEIWPQNATKRLGIEFTVVSRGKFIKLDSKTSFDDEYSPGMFVNLKYLFGEKNLDSSFVGLMPNAYIAERMIAKTIDTRQTDMTEVTTKQDETLKKNNAFFGLYGDSEGLFVNQMNITFGSKKQEFYTKNNMTEFSFVVGLNVLPEPDMSLFIKLVVIIGSGLSLLVLLIFPVSIYLMAKKMRRSEEDDESALVNSEEGVN